MRKGTAALGLVALIALVIGLGSVFANDAVNVTVTLLPNGADDAGCLVGEVAIPVGDFGEIVQEDGVWRGSETVTMTVPLSQDLIPQAIECRLEIMAEGLTAGGGSGVISGAHLAVAGCDLVAPVSLASPQAMTCAVDTQTSQVEVLVSLVGLDQPPASSLSGTIVVSGVNGT